MKYNFDYSEEKNLILREARGIGFEEIIDAVTSGDLVADLTHPKRKNQRILLVKIEKHIFVVPYVEDKERGASFLKTLYPNRKYSKMYQKNKKFYEKI